RFHFMVENLGANKEFSFTVYRKVPAFFGGTWSSTWGYKVTLGENKISIRFVLTKFDIPFSDILEVVYGTYAFLPGNFIAFKVRKKGKTEAHIFAGPIVSIFGGKTDVESIQEIISTLKGKLKIRKIEGEVSPLDAEKAILGNSANY
ncbi:MAG: hypothetical protein V1847_02625, partial [Candidatus Diapherotrites archaeon]